MNPVVEAVRQKYPGVYDDLTDDQLTLAIGKKYQGAYDDIKEFSDDFKRVSPYVAKMEDVGISGGEFENVQQVDLPPFGKPGTFTRGLSKALTSTVSGATSPGGVATGAALMVPGVGPALGVGMSAAALWQAAQKAQEAMETGNPEAAGEAAGMGVAGAAGTLLGVRGAAGPKVREGVPPRPPRPSPLPRSAAEAAKDATEFKPSFTIGLPEEPGRASPQTPQAPKPLPSGEPSTPQPVRAPATRTTIASRILQKAGLDPATADRFAGWVSTRAVGESLEAFRNDVLGKLRESGLQFPGQISLYRTEPSYYEAMGFNPQEVAEHVRNAEIANRKAVSDVQASNARVLDQLESGKSAPAKPTVAPPTRAPGTATAMPTAGELTPDEAQNLFLDKATAEDNAAIEQTKPAPAAPEQAPETQAPTAATVSEARPGGVAAPAEPPALISQPTTEGQKRQPGVTEPKRQVTISDLPDAENANKTMWYHGGRETITEPSSSFTKIESLLGSGFYLTDDPTVGKTYARGPKGQLHEVVVDVRRVANFEKPLEPDVAKAFIEAVYPQFLPEIERGIEEGKTGMQLWKALTEQVEEESQGDMIPKSEYEDMFQAIESNLREIGVDALTHIGGLRAGKGKNLHQVLVLLDPRGELGSKAVPQSVRSINPVSKEPSPADPAEPPAQGPGMKKGEIRPGPKPYDPSATSMGIRPPLTPFMREDVIPAVQTVVSGITETLEGLRNLLSPVSAGPLARLGAGVIREHAGRLAQKDVQMRAKFAAAHAAMAKMDKPSTLNWLDAVEGGARGTLTGPLRQFADEARAALDDRLRQVQALGTGKLQHFIQDYFPHLWKRPDNAINWLQRIFGKRPLRGPASFLKHRTIPTTREGVDAGLEPVSWNPMDILLAKLHEMDRYIMGQKIFQEFKDKGLAKFSRSDIAPKGYAKIDDRIGNVIQYRPTVTVSGAPGAPERVLRGHWFVQEDAARVLNNFLSPGLERYAWYKALRWVGNNMNMATLGLSGYHGMFTMIDAGTSKLALGIEQASRGQPVAAATIPRGLLGTLAANQVEAFVKGSKVLQEYTKPGSVGGEYAKIVDGLIAAGGRVQMPEIYQNSTLRNFMNAFRKGNYTGAVLRTPAAALHAFAYPLMNVVVPRLKLGVFFDMARMELDRLGPTASRDEVREVLGKVWDSVDNRMGELVYDNLFWRKVLKDLSFLVIRSVGWNLGTLRELGGGVLDSAAVIKRLSNGDPVLTRRMAYAIALPFTVGLMGALYQYLRTGKGPQEAEDYFYPKTGNTLPEGQSERVNFPSYLKDVESVKRHPVQTVINKMHPMWGAIAEMLQNKDYYGTEIIHPGDPLVRKVADELKFIAKSFVPYGISGAEKRGKIEPGIQPKVESFFGIMPVPAELTRTPAENLAITLMSGHKPTAARTKAEFERSQKERDAVQQIKMGKLTLDQAKRQGLVDPQRVKEIQERLRFGYLQYAMKHLSVDEAFQVLEKANPKEASSVTTELRARIMRSTTIPAKEKQAYFKMLDQVSKRK